MVVEPEEVDDETAQERVVVELEEIDDGVVGIVGLKLVAISIPLVRI